MNWAHLHLLLNHIPVLGTAFALALLAWGVVRRNESLQRTALGACVIVALLALPVYFTGEPAEGMVKNAVGVSDQAIDAHEEAALVSLIGVKLLGVIALGGLYVSRGKRSLSAKVTRTALLVSLATAALMARTANLGGQIRHVEIRAGTGSGAPQHGEVEDGR